MTPEKRGIIMASMSGKMKASELLAEVFSLKAVHKAVAKANQKRIQSAYADHLAVVESIVATASDRKVAIVNVVMGEVETLKLDPMDGESES